MHKCRRRFIDTYTQKPPTGPNFVQRTFYALLIFCGCGVSLSVNAVEAYAWLSGQHTDNDGFYHIVYPAAANLTTLWESKDGAPVVRIATPPPTTGMHRSELVPRGNGTYTYSTSTRVCSRPGGGSGESGTPVCVTNYSNGPTIVVNSPRPVVNLTNPATAIDFHTNTTFRLKASASVSVGTLRSVVFQANGTALYTDTQAPYEYNWTPEAGNYQVTAVATDNNGDVTVSAVRTVGVTVNQVPSVAITSPAGSSSVYTDTTVVFAVDASDTDGSVSRVNFYADEVLLGTDDSAPFAVSWIPTVYGAYTLTAVAEDDDGAVKTSAARPFTVLNTAPAISLSAPADAASITGNHLVTLTTEASDSDGQVVAVDFRVNDLSLGIDTSAPFEFPWVPRAVGDYTLSAVATDNGGAVTTAAPVSVNVPQVWGTKLTAGALTAQRFAVYYGDLDGLGGADVFFRGKDGIVLLHGEIITPIVVQPASFVVYQNGAGAAYSEPQLLSLSAEQLAKLTPAGSNDVLFADVTGDSRDDLFVRGATADDAAFIVAEVPNAKLPRLLIEYDNQRAPKYHNFSSREVTLVLEDINADGRADIALVGGGVYGDDVTYLLDADGAIGGTSGTDTQAWASTEAVVVADAEILSPETMVHDASVGAVAGRGGVSGGQANYRIPIDIPPGRKGVQPQMELSYSSSGGNGIVGMGWSLSATSSIARCAKTVADDGRNSTVQYHVTNDRLCLDGQRLRLVSGSYGVSGAVYRTAVDNFARVTQNGGINGLNTSFTVDLKNGRQRFYGSNADSRHQPAGAPAILGWALSRERDRSGNGIGYHYQAFGAGEYLLTDIDYTSRIDTDGTTTHSGDRHVQLVYEQRPDFSSRYLAGGLTRQTQRLRAINTYHGATHVRRYSVDYQQSAASERSLISSIQECGAQALSTCKPATVFNWLDSKPQFVLEKVGYRSGVPANSGEEGGSIVEQLQQMRTVTGAIPHGDLNGDGSPDWPGWLMDAEGVYRGTNPNEFRGCTYNSYTGSYGCVEGDFNQDGLTDSWRVVNDRVEISYAPKNGGTRYWINTNITLPSLGDAPFNIADYNADGWPDLLVTQNAYTNNNPEPKSIRVWIHTGQLAAPYSGSGQVVYTYGEHNLGGGAIVTTTGSQLVGDMDGDGLPDMIHTDLDLQAYPGFTPSQQPVPKTLQLTRLDSQGNLSFVEQDLSSHALGQQFNSTGQTAFYFHYFMDINGDALPDWLSWKGTDSSLWLSINKGAGQFDTWQPLGVTLASRRVAYTVDQGTPADFTYVLYPRYAHAFRQFDYDADGRAELLMPGATLTTTCLLISKIRPNNQVVQENLCGGSIYEPYFYQTGQPPRSIPLGNSDYNAFRYNALRFVEQADGSFQAVSVATDLVGTANQSTPVDAFGNGLNDLVFAYGCRFSIGCSVGGETGQMEGREPGVYVNRNRGSARHNERFEPTDMLVSVETGLGVKDEWHYRPLSSHDNRYHGSDKPFYQPDFEYLDGLASAVRLAHLHFTSSMYVVAEHRHSNGVGGLNQRQYRYKGAMLNREGRGFQGFRSVIVEDLAAGVETRSDFHQVFPLTGRLHRVRQWSLDDLSGDNPDPLVDAYQETRYTWRLWPDNQKGGGEDYTVAAPTNSWLAASSDPYFVGLYKQETIQRKLAQSNGSRTELFRRSEVRDYDYLGNVLSDETRYAEPGDRHVITSTTETRYDYQSVGDWWLSKPSKQTVMRSAVAGRQGVDIAVDTDTGHSVVIDYLAWDTTARQPETVKTTPASGKWVRLQTRYNSHGLPISQTQSAQGEVSGRVTLTEYSADGYFTRTVTNPLGHVIESEINPHFGKPNWAIDQNGLVTSYHYDVFGQPIGVEAPGVPTAYRSLSWCDSNCPGEGVVRVHEQQDGSPERVNIIDRLGRVIQTETESFAVGQHLISAIRFNALGQTTFESVAQFDNVASAGTHYTAYDLRGRLMAKVVDQTAGQARETTYTHEQGSRGFTTEINAGGLLLSRTYNGLEQLLETVDALDGITRYAYDGSGNPIVMEDANGQRIITRYNALGQKRWVLDPNMGRKDFTYTGFGALASETNAAGQRTDFRYDPLDRPTRRSVDGVAEARWLYDTALNGVGLLATEERLDQAFSKTYDYDSLSRPVSIATHIDGERFVITQQYDSYFGRPKGMGYPSGLTLAYDYNARGYPTRVSNAGSDYVYREITAMSAFGQWQGATLAAGTAYANRTVDAATGQLTHVSVENLLFALHDQQYRYDVFGNLTRMATTVFDMTPATNEETFIYDDNHRLISSSRSDGGTITYNYDAVGNLKVKDDYGHAYHYDHPQANAVSSVDLVGGGSVSFGYDANGNRTHENGSQTLWYNAFNKPVKISRLGAQVEFFYGADQMRYKQINSAANRTTLYIDKLYEKITENGSTRYRHFIGDIAVITTRESASGSDHRIGFIHRDRLDSGVAVLDAIGGLRETHSFDPFGKPRLGNAVDKVIATLSSSLTTRGFTDHEHLDNVQLIHMNGRAYDYHLGRFLSVDPVIQAPGNSQSLNPYSYILNNPLAGTDPSGYASSCNENAVGCSQTKKTTTKRARPPTGTRISRTKTTVVQNGSSISAKVVIDGKTVARVAGVVGSDGSVNYIAQVSQKGLDSRGNVSDANAGVGSGQGEWNDAGMSQFVQHVTAALESDRQTAALANARQANSPMRTLSAQKGVESVTKYIGDRWEGAKWNYNAVANGLSEDFSDGFWKGIINFTGGRSDNSFGEDFANSYGRTSIAVGPLRVDKTAAGLLVGGQMAKTTGGLTFGQWARSGFGSAAHLPTRLQTGSLVVRTAAANGLRVGVAYETGNSIGAFGRVATNRAVRFFVDD